MAQRVDLRRRPGGDGGPESQRAAVEHDQAGEAELVAQCADEVRIGALGAELGGDPLEAVQGTVIEHRCQRERCPGCGQTAMLPSEVASSAFGPRLQAAIVTLSIRNRISRRDVVELCEQLFSSRISTGTIDAILTRAGDALAEPYADLLDRVGPRAR